MQIEETLIKLYGPMLTMAQLAKVLDRSTKGLTISLLRADSDWARALNAAKKKVGRRVYFRTPDIAKFLSSE